MSWKDIITAILNSLFKPKPPNPNPTPNPIPGPNNLLDLHNQHRQQLHLGVLNLHPSLVKAAQKHSEWMNQNKRLDHNENGKTPGDRINAEGYRYYTYGENIAMGYSTAEKVFIGWLNSSGHRANIENSRFKDVGFGVSGTYWTAVFAASNMSLSEELFNLPEGITGE